jgi:LacI family transcriptional regulator
VSPHNEDPYFAAVLTGIESASDEAGYNVIVCYSDCDVEKERKNISMLLDKGVDAIVIYCPIDDTRIATLVSLDVPVLFLQYFHDTIPTDSIQTDDVLGGYIATKHLLDLGHTRIACLAEGNPDIKHTYLARENGWRKALSEKGITVDERYLLKAKMCPSGGYDAFTSLMKIENPPTAVFCFNDYLAIGSIRAAADLSIRIPDDVSIVGFDDLHMANYMTPRLTTVAQPKEDLGKMVFSRLLERIKDRSIRQGKKLLNPELIIRESTGPIGS